MPEILRLGFEQLPLREEDRKSSEMRNALPFGYFRRKRGEELELLEIQLDKRGKPAFVLNLAVIPAEGADVPWQHFEQDEAPITAAREAYRLYHQKNPGPLGSWFRVPAIGLPLDLKARTEKTVNAAVALLPEVEGWFTHHVVGPHMRIHGHAAISRQLPDG